MIDCSNTFETHYIKVKTKYLNLTPSSLAKRPTNSGDDLRRFKIPSNESTTERYSSKSLSEKDYKATALLV